MSCWKWGWGFQSSEGGYRHHLACPIHHGSLQEQTVVGKGWNSLLLLCSSSFRGFLSSSWELSLQALHVQCAPNLRHCQVLSFSLGQPETLHGSRESSPLPPAHPTALLFLWDPTQSLPWGIPSILLSLTLLQYSPGRFFNCSSACWQLSLHIVKVHMKTFSWNI